MYVNRFERAFQVDRIVSRQVNVSTNDVDQSLQLKFTLSFFFFRK
jgi:hypothetical protein